MGAHACAASGVGNSKSLVKSLGQQITLCPANAVIRDAAQQSGAIMPANHDGEDAQSLLPPTAGTRIVHRWFCRFLFPNLFSISK
ncbi:hypothetical protein B6N31_20995 [Dickeya fangzhongdai]|uniref:hypothetical protein n=1 Tax=Dickeya TaxID=204037 RepID=UPI00067607F8|nr:MULTISPECIES: hypothetical protein [Dickeya]AYH49943.1 hypothetical protein B6N31_20995 [Dickeya fangzhongdai]